MPTTTFLFTDIEGSTQLWDAHGDAMDAALRRHDALLEQAVSDHGGRVFKHTGDGILASFASVTEAAAAAAAAQRSLAAEDFGMVGRLRVRMAIHTGEATERDGDFFGTALNRAARVMDAGRGGQVLLSASAASIVRARLPDGLHLDDLGEHRLKDLGEPERIHQLCGPGLDSDFGPVRSLGRHPNNLPVQVTSFVGRERELAEVADLLVENRIVTVTGVGGVGKTRLALQVAAETVDTFRDGVWLVELASLDRAGLVLPAIAAAAGISESPTHPLVETVIEELSGGPVLLVIDNCEHLIDEVAKVTDGLLRGCPDLRVLATSREGLAVAGERLWQCPSMAAATDAVELFVDRAELFGGIDVDDADTRLAVERICRRLDGIPLAIELATARLKVFTPQQLAARLDDRFRLLTGGARTALPRQRTLQAAMDWSHDLLANHERVLLRRLGVFYGGFTLELAERVCADDVLPDWEVLGLVARLVDASLVTFEGHEDPPRYRLLETVRQYAMDRLVEAGEADTFRHRHAEEFDAMMTGADAGLLGRDADRWLTLCRAEEDNVRAALTWAVEAGEHALALRLAAEYGRYWFNTGRVAEATEQLTRVLRSEHPDSVHLAEANSWLAHFLFTESKLTEAHPYAVASLEIAERLGDPHVTLRSRMVQANIASAAGRITDAVEAYRSLAAAAREVGSDYLQIALHNVATHAHQMGDFETSRAAAEELLARSETTGQEMQIALARSVAAMVAFFRGDLEEAMRHIAIGESHAAEGFGTAGFAVVRANVALLEGDLDEAVRQVDRTLALLEGSGQQDLVDLCSRLLGHVALRRGDTEAAFEHFDRVLHRTLSRPTTLDDAAQIGTEMAAVALARGMPGLAAALFEIDRARRESRGQTLPVPWQEMYDEVERAIAGRLGPDGLTAAREQVASMQGRQIAELVEELRSGS